MQGTGVGGTGSRTAELRASVLELAERTGFESGGWGNRT